MIFGLCGGRRLPRRSLRVSKSDERGGIAELDWEAKMPAARDAHQTTTGDVVVKDEEGDAWVLRKDWQNTSMTRNEQLSRAINLFNKGTVIAFERYDEARHGSLLGAGIICLCR